MIKVLISVFLLYGFACSNAEFSAELEDGDGDNSAHLDAITMDAQGGKGRIITSGADLPDGWRSNTLSNTLVSEFVANPSEEREKTLQWGGKQQSERINLVQRRARLGAERIVQLARTTHTAEVRQTYSSQQTINKTFDASKPGILDILMVIDNSNDKSGVVLGVDLAKKNINHHQLANKLAGLLTDTGVLSGIDWKLVLATSERYVKNITPLIRGKYLPGQAAEFKKKIRSFAQDTAKYKAWNTKIEKVVWKARKVMGDFDQPDSKAWKGKNWENRKTHASKDKQTENFFPYSVWQGSQWVKSSNYASKHSWLREGSSLAVILISDEDLQNTRSPTSYYGLAPDTRIAGKYPWDSFYGGMTDHIVREMNYHRPQRDDQDMWRLYGVFDTKTTCNDLNFNTPNTKYYKKYVWEHPDNNSTGELKNPCFDCRSLTKNRCHFFEQRVFDSNHKPFAQTFLNNQRYFSEIFYLYDGSYALNKIAEDIQKILQHDFRLDHDEDKINSITVRVDNELIDSSKYELDGYILKLARGILTANSRQVKVRYEIDRAKTSSWLKEITLANRKLASRSTLSNVKLKIRRDRDGAVVDLQEGRVWEYVQNSEKIKLKQKTVEGTLLALWQENPVRKTSFAIKNNSIKIYNIVDIIIGNRTLTSGFNFNDTLRRFTFDSVYDAPDYGEVGLVRYRYSTGKKTSYPFYAGKDLEGTVKCRTTCSQSGSDLACTYNASSRRIILSNTVDLDDLDHFETCYEFKDTKPTSFPLPDNVLDNTVELSIDGEVVCNEEQLLITDNSVSLSESNDCDALDDLQSVSTAEVTINYSVVNTDEEFVVPEPSVDLSLYSTEYWEVFVNDEQTEDYSRDSRTISFNDLPPDSKVKVIVYLLP